MPPNFREWIHTIAELNMHMHVSRLVHIKMLQNELTTGPNISHAILLASMKYALNICCNREGHITVKSLSNQFNLPWSLLVNFNELLFKPLKN